MHRRTCTYCRSSGLASKQLSAVVALGASTAKAEEVNTLISSTIPECCVLICLHVLLACKTTKPVSNGINAANILYNSSPVRKIWQIVLFFFGLIFYFLL